MSHVIMLIPVGIEVGLTSVKLGIAYAIEHTGIRTSIFNPIYKKAQIINNFKNQKNTIFYKNCNLSNVNSLEISYVESLLSKNRKDILLEEIVTNYYRAKTKNTEVILIEGLTLSNKYQFIQSLNYEIARSLNAEIIFVISHDTDTLEQLKKRIKLLYNEFNDTKDIIGVIINKLNAPINGCKYIISNFSNVLSSSTEEEIDPNILQHSFCTPPILGAIPWNRDLIVIRAIDIVHYLNASIINRGIDLSNCYLTSIILCTQNIQYLLKYFNMKSLLIISPDRYDVLLATCLAIKNGIKIGAVLLTDNYKIDANINKLCESAFVSDLPIFKVNTDIWQTFINLQNFNLKVYIENNEHTNKIQKYVAQYIKTNWIKSLASLPKRKYTFSPTIFLYKLTELARKADKRIVLPESNELRIIKAAAICAEKNIATCVLLGNPDKIKHIAALQNIKLNSNIEIVDPNLIRENYIARLVELRKNKGMVETIAREQLKDDVILATLMLERGEVDGLVSGAIHTTANTIRPSLQLIKTIPGSSLVSSVFFMLLPDKVYVYGDCAINLNPTAEQLAEIAIQSANSAAALDIEPRIAMLSYSTGTSGSGSDVEKIREATYIAQKKRPDLIIDGPLQYDAAVTNDIAKFKAPNSPVAGRATIFIFPDLNTGNITYKAVQRSANLISIGPILQGMRKPVNDLSRGALINDIIYTIAITAIQATWK